jgi:hypothetical protein
MQTSGSEAREDYMVRPPASLHLLSRIEQSIIEIESRPIHGQIRVAALLQALKEQRDKLYAVQGLSGAVARPNTGIPFSDGERLGKRP